MLTTYQNKKVLLAVTGGIAAYKVTELVRQLVKGGAIVRVMMTPTAEDFVSQRTLAILSQNPVLTEADWQAASAAVDHVAWARWADLLVLVPLTANTMAKLAQGLADNVLTTTTLASPAVKLAVPAMNDVMWASPAVQRNAALLQADGVHLLGPAEGFLAEGYAGKGRLVPLEQIMTTIGQLLAEEDRSARAADQLPDLPDLSGRQVVITAGGTREAIDPVRYLTNRSSGKMGYALANAAAIAGAKVTLVTTVDRPCDDSVKQVFVETAVEMLAAVETALPTADLFIGAAAVSDFRLAHPAAEKIKKSGPDDGLTLQLVQNPDILRSVAQAKKPGQLIVGFAAETNDPAANAQKKLARKQVDCIVLNDVSQAGIGFNGDDNAVTVFRPGQPAVHFERMKKTALAAALLRVFAQSLDELTADL
ncbi:bifunctional phosphopantothenoylcysteine decarboxylase/phosphopantothenate--cysteine ligase CoaBC [Leuconostocaceae bacterium ESL0958]|nr:bifunctional phosphopantothenoylcysteine decarboxylase/phosphopantothenate--cysteine ligase CoaBC [Leuconostocaceae bacterium ESL0958]